MISALKARNKLGFNNHAKLTKLMQFLNVLDDYFTQVRRNILLMDHLPNVKIALSFVSREKSNQKHFPLSKSNNNFC